MRASADGNHSDQQRENAPADYHVDEHGVGSHLEPSGSFLKCGLTTYGAFRVHRILDDRGDEEERAAIGERRDIEVL